MYKTLRDAVKDIDQRRNLIGELKEGLREVEDLPAVERLLMAELRANEQSLEQILKQPITFSEDEAL